MRWEPSVQKSYNSHWHCFFKLRLGTQHCTLLLGSSGTCGSVTNTHPGPSQTASYPTARFLVQDQIHMASVNFWCREVKKNCYRRQARANYISHALCHFDSITGLTISLQIRFAIISIHLNNLQIPLIFVVSDCLQGFQLSPMLVSWS